MIIIGDAVKCPRRHKSRHPMVFLPAFLIAAYANLIPAVRGLSLRGHPGLIAQAHFICCLTGALGLLLGFELVPGPNKGISDDTHNWSVAAFFAFGALTTVLFSARLRSVARDKHTTDPLALRFGVMLLAVLSGLYLCGTTIDHYLFFREPATSGVAQSATVGPNVKCNTNVIVRFTDGRATFRCPTLLVFGRDYSHPFIPWPSYTQGETASDVVPRSITNVETTHGATSSKPVFSAPARATAATDPRK
jgi:hypothetical protein